MGRGWVCGGQSRRVSDHTTDCGAAYLLGRGQVCGGQSRMVVEKTGARGSWGKKKVPDKFE